ncbi:MAG TPA: 23S rRNA (adenine(2503)-C(2))-methyltransferase RlmN [bacterium]|nr:23S rRNA (adenine(2503)-C(2))-methyltransferase RlmN [bacterium]
MTKIDLIGMTLEAMQQLMVSVGEPNYRGNQLFTWVYKKRVDNLDQITVFSKDLRQQLAKKVDLELLDITKQQRSADGETTKFLFRLSDGAFVESVFMVDGKRRTVCISTQVGCALGCKFCATGKMGLLRNLSTGEMVGQLLTILKMLEVEATNLVLMGMGEPFLNYDNVKTACEIISHSDGIAIGKRKITVSTAGIVPGIKKFTDEQMGCKLAISLNAADNKTRSRLMPINRKYPLTELINAAKYYSAHSRHLFTFEYLMIAGVNDSIENARKLKKMLQGLRCKINIIPYNAVGEQWQPPREEQINRFITELLELKIIVSVRRSKGADIDAACGQLCHLSNQKKL